ncbi:MAG: 50S ribosomal protein L11 methyltransferase [Dehalococcoidia bacterium]|nr:50S ribosomal protein L11 methyltransferase [Dehalococcoidia bacterium]
MPVDWWEISARIPARLADAAADRLSSIAGGAVAIDLPFTQEQLEDAPVLREDAEATVRVYVPATSGRAEREALRRRANRVLAPLAARVHLRRVGEHDWAESWKRHFPVQRIGRRLVIRPVWLAYAAAPDDVVIDLDPGIAFGTGDHPTTRGCLECAERLVAPGITVLDLGCGSGILSIAAAKLGAAGVWALDIDPFAADAARANVALNGLDARIRVVRGSLGNAAPAGLPPQFDLILANIASGPLSALAPALAGALAPGGAIVASGIIAERMPLVVDAFARAGLAVEETIAEGEWRTLVARGSAG